MDCSPPGSSVLGISQVRMLEWVAFPKGIFLIWGSNLGLSHRRQTLYCLSHHRSPFRNRERWKRAVREGWAKSILLPVGLLGDTPSYAGHLLDHVDGLGQATQGTVPRNSPSEGRRVSFPSLVDVGFMPFPLGCHLPRQWPL